MKNKINKDLGGILKVSTLVLFFLSIFIYLVNKNTQQDRFYSSIPDLKERIKTVENKFPAVSIVTNEDIKTVDAMNNDTGIFLKEEYTIGYDDKDTNTIFYNATNLKTDQHGFIYIAFYRPTLIKKYDKNVKFIKDMGRKGQGPGEFLGPLMMSVCGDSLYVYDWVIKRISVFDSSGFFCNSIQLDIPPSARVYGFFYNPYLRRFWLSFYDREKDKTIHIFNRNGGHIFSYGEPLLCNGTSNYLDERLKTNASKGRLYWRNDRIYFSRFNPYELREYSIDGNLEKVIFRINKFMPRDKIEILNEESIRIRVPPQSNMISFWHNFIINCATVPSWVDYPYKTVIDFFTTDGRLYASLGLKDDILFTELDQESKLYGIKTISETQDRAVVCFSLKSTNSRLPKNKN